MRKVLMIIFFEVLTIGACGAAMAEAVKASAVATETYTWAMLATTSGTIAATLLIVQLVKAPLDKVFHIPTQIFVFIVAAVITSCAHLFTGEIGGVGDALLVVLNAVPVALSAMGTYEVTFSRIDRQAGGK